ncbi:hypothetical protein [Cellulophaga baltica]|uniref:hypothetical protein n=1 Tax=Cellulophaga baltica TaxID=76594 RepID=UPI0015F3A6D6|nr:hypothetical protein [Cellulophaga baltica]MBA6314672.1 hypothetical protein [Cellulophaga baltica]
MQKSILFILVLVGALHVLIAQQHKTHTTLIDFNKDTVLDTLIHFNEYGSYCGGSDVTIINGKTKEKFFLTDQGCYSSFTRFVRVPTALNSKANAAFLKVVKDTILPKKRGRPDSSLNWLLSGSLSLKVVEEHPLFDRIAVPKTNWIPNELNLPEPYYITVTGDSLQKIAPKFGPSYDEKFNAAFLVYYPSMLSKEKLAHNTPILKNNTYEIYNTAHSVYVKKGTSYKWLFISDNSVMGAPGKLRWDAIEQIQLIDNYLIIHQNLPPDPIYNIVIVNIETQHVARLKFEPCHETMTNKRGMDTFEIRNKKLLFTAYGDPKVRKIPLKKLFKALDQF